MNNKTCVRCDSAVEGEVEDVPLTLCCADCATKNRRRYNHVYKGFARVSKSRALSTYYVAESDLASLHFATLPNPVSDGGPPMKLYVAAEVECLGELRLQETRRRDAERDCGALIGKRIGIEDFAKIRLAKMDPVLRHFAVGDYLDKGSGTVMQWDDVTARLGVADRVAAILSECAGAHPGAAFDFCLRFPEAGPREFVEAKEKLRLVLRLEGPRILHNLPVGDLVRLEETVLADVYADFLSRDPRSIIKGHLTQWFSDKTAEEILADPAVRPRLEAGGEELGIAEKLKAFWGERSEKTVRSERLRRALAKRGISAPSNCATCREYVDGDIDCDVEEVVGIAEIYHLLALRGIPMLSGRCCHLEAGFRFALHKLKLPYEDAVARASTDVTWLGFAGGDDSGSDGSYVTQDFDIGGHLVAGSWFDGSLYSDDGGSSIYPAFWESSDASSDFWF